MAAVKSLKMIVIGPASSGKSVLANFLVDQVDLTKAPYNPTKGVRILEADVSSSGAWIIGAKGPGPPPPLNLDLTKKRQHSPPP